MSEAQVSNFPCDCLSNKHSYPVLSEAFVQDLAWVIFSPSLVLPQHDHLAIDQSLWGFPATRALLLEKLTRLNSEAELTAIHQGRLGKYFESLLSFALQQLKLSPFSLVAKNIQLSNGKRTLGEIDFLLKGQDTYLHLETAVKFYLRPKGADAGQLENWIGPNAQDRLDKKYHHLRDKQLRLLKSKAAQSALVAKLPFMTEQEIQKTEARYYLKGMLFTHWTEQAVVPNKLNPQLLFGHWLYQSEFYQLQKNGGADFTPLTKLQWLGGNTLGGNSTESTKAIKSSQDVSLPAMFMRKQHQNAINQRLIVVPDYWPATSSPSRKI